jgi:hypothetical protein
MCIFLFTDFQCEKPIQNPSKGDNGYLKLKMVLSAYLNPYGTMCLDILYTYRLLYFYSLWLDVSDVISGGK